MNQKFTPNDFEHDYIVATLASYRAEPQVTDKYACILTAFTVGRSASERKA